MVSDDVGLTVAGVVTAGLLFALGFIPAVAAIPASVMALGGWTKARGFHRPMARAQVALDQLLDRLEAGEFKLRVGLCSTR